ncbi:helix-turn-helix domain-containing protein [Sphingomonas sp. MMS24-JH45]
MPMWISAFALPPNSRRLRISKGWSQEKFAFEASIHRTYVSDLERGARNPTITVVEKLAKPSSASRRPICSPG